MCKDFVYDFLKNEWVDQVKILTNFSRQFLKITKSKGVSTDIYSPKCLIVDDTLLCKTGLWHVGGSDKISMAIHMLKYVIKTGFEPFNVLAGSLFMCNTFMAEIQKIKIRYTKNINVIICLSE